jgi:hypothetical protein
MSNLVMVDPIAMSPALFKATLDSCVEALKAEGSRGFTVSDIAARMGATKPSAALRRRMQRRLETLCRSGVLVAPGHGVYIASSESSAVRETTIKPVLLGDLHKAFFDAGGFMHMGEILEALDLDNDQATARRVRVILSESPLFDSYNPLPGKRRCWRLADDERAKVPVPGRWMLANLQLTVLRAGGGKLAWTWGLVAEFEAYQQRVGRALRDARNLWRLTPEQFTDGTIVGEALDYCLGWCAEPYIDIGTQATEGSVGDWWNEVKEGMGTKEATAEAWMMLEDGHPSLIGALDVAMWMAVGKQTKLDPALLSRGSVDFNWRSTTSAPAIKSTWKEFQESALASNGGLHPVTYE